MGSSKDDGNYLDIAANESSDNSWYSIEGYMNFFKDITVELELMTGSEDHWAKHRKLQAYTSQQEA